MCAKRTQKHFSLCVRRLKGRYLQLALLDRTLPRVHDVDWEIKLKAINHMSRKYIDEQ